MIDNNQKEVVVSEKRFFSLIACIIVAVVSVALNPLSGTYGIIIGAFFTWVMASYLYAVYGSKMLDSIRSKILLFTPTSIYTVLVIVLFLQDEKLVVAVSQILGAVSITIALYIFLSILMEYYKVKGMI